MGDLWLLAHDGYDGQRTRETHTVVFTFVCTLPGISPGAIDVAFETFDVWGAGCAASLQNEDSRSTFRKTASGCEFRHVVRQQV